MEELRAVAWTGDALRLVDQTLLPDRLVHRDVREVGELVDAIKRLVVRGAPALGVTGAYGVAIAVRQGMRAGWDQAALDAAIDRIRDARPTAVNLAAGVERVRPYVARGLDAVLAEAHRVLAEDVEGNRAIAAHGADWILTATSRRPLRVLTHCNTGALACGGWGTALGVIRELHNRGLLEAVYVDETRPLLQGSRLTAFELAHAGIPHYVQADGAAPSTVVRGLVDLAVFGADRIAANGDVANKIGSLGVALACADAGVPCVVAAPWSTVDQTTGTGADIEIELRDPAEVLGWNGTRTAPPESAGFNPAFDVTPARLVSALATETGVLEVSRGQTPASRVTARRGSGG